MLTDVEKKIALRIVSCATYTAIFKFIYYNIYVIGALHSIKNGYDKSVKLKQTSIR